MYNIIKRREKTNKTGEAKMYRVTKTNKVNGKDLKKVLMTEGPALTFVMEAHMDKEGYSRISWKTYAGANRVANRMGGVVEAI